MLRSALGTAARARRAHVGTRGLSSQLQPTHVGTWLRENAASFAPPVMNKLLHREQLSVMFVGGPNKREDFHLEAGSEFFYQLKGDMELPIVHAGVREVIHIREGDVFLLPSCIPHSPQRPHEGSIGLVVERQRYEDEPHDGLRFYQDFKTAKDVLWEKYFHCYDLGRDLVPVVQAYNASEAKRTGKPDADSVVASPPLREDVTTRVPHPFSLSGFLEEHAGRLDAGEAVNLFEGHPDGARVGVCHLGARYARVCHLGASSGQSQPWRISRAISRISRAYLAGEFAIEVVGGESARDGRWRHETFLYQLRGGATVVTEAGEHELSEDDCCIVPPDVEYTIRRPRGTRGLVLTNDPLANAAKARPEGAAARGG